MKTGLFHLYIGDGKGKSTAAIGLALRMLGSGHSVTLVQFLKDGRSSELEPLRKLGAAVFSGNPDGSPVKFSFQMTIEEKEFALRLHGLYLKQAAETRPELLILDEACAALETGLLDEQLLRRTVLLRPDGQEIVITGRNPTQWMLKEADYVTEMKCIRHPYQNGIQARYGVEF